MDRIQVDDGRMEGIKSYCSQQSPNTKPVTMTSECSDKRILVQTRAGTRDPAKGCKGSLVQLAATGQRVPNGPMGRPFGPVRQCDWPPCERIKPPCGMADMLQRREGRAA
uniref:Uncharacterized protein n=1 Tax=Anopheles merus TaxID=30066 RepID=A0A182V7M1_ANOME